MINKCGIAKKIKLERRFIRVWIKQICKYIFYFVCNALSEFDLEPEVTESNGPRIRIQRPRKRIDIMDLSFAHTTFFSRGAV